MEKFEQKIHEKNGFKREKHDKDKTISLDEVFSGNEKIYEHLQEIINQGSATLEKEKNERGEIIKVTIKEKGSGRVLFYQDTKGLKDLVTKKEAIN